jgi:hypothetical protein
VPVKVIIRLSAREELQALPVLLRHSPGMGLANRTYVISTEAARALREAGVRFAELDSDAIRSLSRRDPKRGEMDQQD